MPELPEVETVARFCAKELVNGTVEKITFYRDNIRFPIPKEKVVHVLKNCVLRSIFRRAKYILFATDNGYSLWHLGMSGRLLVMPDKKPVHMHTHVIIAIRRNSDTQYLHFVDPRRFGVVDAAGVDELNTHPLLQHLGVEPLITKDLGSYLWQISRRRKTTIKTFIMDARIVVGVGNIYANEALFLSRIHPETPASQIDLPSYKDFAGHIQKILKQSIRSGGTTLRDYVQSNGDRGDFAAKLFVYGRDGKPCKRCHTSIQAIEQSGRRSWYCPQCQTSPKLTRL